MIWILGLPLQSNMSQIACVNGFPIFVSALLLALACRYSNPCYWIVLWQECFVTSVLVLRAPATAWRFAVQRPLTVMKRPAASHDANAGGVDGKGAGGVGLAWLQTQRLLTISSIQRTWMDMVNFEFEQIWWDLFGFVDFATVYMWDSAVFASAWRVPHWLVLCLCILCFFLGLVKKRCIKYILTCPRNIGQHKCKLCGCGPGTRHDKAQSRAFTGI